MHVQDLIQAANVCRKAKDFRAAIDLFQQALAQEPDQLQALKGLADAYRGLGAVAECLATWDRYLALRPGDPGVQVRVADACRRCGLVERAVSHYQGALQIVGTGRTRSEVQGKSGKLGNQPTTDQETGDER